MYNTHATRARVAKGAATLLPSTWSDRWSNTTSSLGLHKKRRAEAPPASDEREPETARLAPEHRVVVPRIAEPEPDLATDVPIVVSPSAETRSFPMIVSPPSSPTSSATVSSTDSDTDTLSSSGREAPPSLPYFRPPAYVGPVAVHDERDWNGTWLSALPREVRQAVLDWVWPPLQNHMFVVYRPTAGGLTSKTYVFRRACAPHLLPSFDLLWRTRSLYLDSVTVDIHKQENLLYTAQFYASAALLFSPEQAWPTRTAATKDYQPRQYYRPYSRQTPCRKRKCWIDGGEVPMRAYMRDRKTFLNCHALLLRMPPTIGNEIFQ